MVSNVLRDSMITAWRARICQQLNLVPFRHQAEWWLASDGLRLLEVEDDAGYPVRLPDRTVRCYATVPRGGGRARVLGDLGAFKVGKSWGAAIWSASFSCIPHARIQLVGLEYDVCEPEFNYIVETLLSESGMNLPHTSLQNRPRDGKMWLDLANGARYEAKSWERKDTLFGKEVDAYVFCEAYMLPGLECYTNFSQNLRARDGYAVLATTPDRPWIKEIHNAAHSGLQEFAAWHCTCGIPSQANPITFSQAAMDRDRTLMTKEKFAIHYLGQLGDFVGRVYGYQRGQRSFTALSHPLLFAGTGMDRDSLRVPDGWECVGGADTGTFSSGVLVAFSPEGTAFVLDEFPNYRYVAGVPELDKDMTIPSWATTLGLRCAQFRMRPLLWADRNSQFKRELINYGLTLQPSTLPFETRTEIAREYFTQGKIFLAPWLSVLPFELENAQWPEEASSAGKFARVKDRDHTLDCLEHVLSRRPRGAVPAPAPHQTWAEATFGAAKRRFRGNIHLGRQ